VAGDVTIKVFEATGQRIRSLPLTTDGALPG